MYGFQATCQQSKYESTSYTSVHQKMMALDPMCKIPSPMQWHRLDLDLKYQGMLCMI